MMYEIPFDLELIINQQMANGNYLSPEEILRDALQEFASRRNVNCQNPLGQNDETPTCNALEALRQNGLVGSIQSGHRDLSTNPVHMEGFGQHGS